MFCRLNERQFEQTVRAYSADLYRYAYWLCRDRFVAEDLVQQTFERAWKHWQDLHDMECAKSWLITILRREYARLYQRMRLDTVDDDPETLDLPSCAQAESQLELEQMVEALPLAYREALLLQTWGGYSCSENPAAQERIFVRAAPARARRDHPAHGRHRRPLLESLAIPGLRAARH